MKDGNWADSKLSQIFFFHMPIPIYTKVNAYDSLDSLYTKEVII